MPARRGDPTHRRRGHSGSSLVAPGGSRRRQGATTSCGPMACRQCAAKRTGGWSPPLQPEVRIYFCHAHREQTPHAQSRRCAPGTGCSAYRRLSATVSPPRLPRRLSHAPATRDTTRPRVLATASKIDISPPHRACHRIITSPAAAVNQQQQQQQQQQRNIGSRNLAVASSRQHTTRHRRPPTRAHRDIQSCKTAQAYAYTDTGRERERERKSE